MIANGAFSWPRVEVSMGKEYLHLLSEFIFSIYSCLSTKHKKSVYKKNEKREKRLSLWKSALKFEMIIHIYF